ncbi:MAG TPA: hypothetical protein VN948_17035 [Terriglobales bacterium]|nr:hypothetical protein [Terriglobales bacterium]
MRRIRVRPDDYLLNFEGDIALCQRELEVGNDSILAWSTNVTSQPPEAAPDSVGASKMRGTLLKLLMLPIFLCHGNGGYVVK